MTRVSGPFVPALELAMAIVLTCAACAPARTALLDRRVVPTSLVDVAFEGFEEVAAMDVDLHTAVQTREAVESEFEVAYGKMGHRRWFFHAFDVATLEFVVARYEPTNAKPARYVAEHRLRVKRSSEAERALGVMDVVFSYERSARSVKVGMSRVEVTAIVGPPETERPSGRSGAFDMRYPAFCVRFVEHKVAHVERRERCMQ